MSNPLVGSALRCMTWVGSIGGIGRKSAYHLFNGITYVTVIDFFEGDFPASLFPLRKV